MTEIEKLERTIDMLNQHKFCGTCTTASVQGVESCTVCDRNTLHKTAIATIREKLDRMKNPALTLDDLRESVHAPAECSALGYVKDLKTNEIYACVFDYHGLYGIVAVWCASTDSNDWYKECDYGKIWLAYRYKPEE